jgi:hypothetical protein
MKLRNAFSRATLVGLFTFALSSCEAPAPDDMTAEMAEPEPEAPQLTTTSEEPMTFFLTSVGVGDGANLGGLEGADNHCQTLAAAVGAGDHTWRAYLSAQATDGQPAVNARDRIGSGPWHNANGLIIASDVQSLHYDNSNIRYEYALNERGETVNLLKLDQQRRRNRHARAPRPDHSHHSGWIMERRPPVPRLQPGEPGADRRSRPVLLLRRQLTSSLRGVGPRARLPARHRAAPTPVGGSRLLDVARATGPRA